MSDASEKPWSDNPYAPQIPSWLYLVEKASFNGITAGTIFYGTLPHTSFYPSLPVCSTRLFRNRSGTVLPVHERVAESR